jgi:hypothetical protein
LFEMVCALHSSCRLAGGLNSRQKDSDQNSNDRNYYQKFNKCKAK